MQDLGLISNSNAGVLPVISHQQTLDATLMAFNIHHAESLAAFIAMTDHGSAERVRIANGHSNNQDVLGNATGSASVEADAISRDDSYADSLGWAICDHEGENRTSPGFSDGSARDSAREVRQGKSSPFRTPFIPNNKSETSLICAACDKHLPGGQFVQARCGHLYCSPCILKLFDHITADEYHYLPACCSQSIRSLDSSHHRLHIENDESEEVLVCVICTDSFKGNPFLRVSCGHYFCSGCVKTSFERAAKYESQCPVVCCGRSLAIASASRFLTPRLEYTYRHKQIESQTPHRTYCHINTCGEFILPSNIENSMAVCDKCLRVTCAECKSAAHRGNCAPNPDRDALMTFAKSQGYQQCRNCQHVVELTTGCYHMT